MAATFDDTELFLLDFGVEVDDGVSEGLGILDQNSELLISGQVVSVNYALTCEAAKFGHLTYGAAVNVDGVGYTVLHEPMRIDDGRMVVLSLSQADAAVDLVLDGDTP